MQQIDHTKNIIELKNVNYSYGDGLAVENVNLEVHRGDYLGIIGPNGGGKSTLLKLTLGLLKAQSGEILLYGKPVNYFQNWSRIGYVSQHTTHIDSNFPMTVEEVVNAGRYSGLGLFRFLGKKDHEKVQNALEKVNMWEYRKRLIGDLSGGEQQRIFIARALAGEPEIIILDEPTAGVDIKTQKQFYSLLQKLNTELNLTLILVSHELDIVAHESTEIAYINRALVYYGIPREFMKSEYFEKLTGKGKHSHV